MRTSTNITVAALVIALVSVGTAVLQLRQARQAKATLAATVEERDELRQRLQRKLQRESRSMAAPANAAKPNTDSAENEADVTRRYQQELARKRATEAKAIAAAQERQFWSPEIREPLAKQFKANLSLRYGRLYATLGLSRIEVEKFESAMVEKFWMMSDLIMSSRSAGLPDAATAQLRGQTLDLIDEKIRGALGEAKYRDYLRHEFTADAGDLVDSLAAKTYYTATPLSAQQADKLSELIVANRTRSPPPDDWLRAQVVTRGTSGLSWTDVNWNAVMETAPSFLSPNQLLTLQAMKDDAQVREVVEREMKKTA